MPIRRRRRLGAPRPDPLQWLEAALTRRGSNVERYQRMRRGLRREHRLRSTLRRWQLRLRTLLGPWNKRRRHDR